MSSDNTNIFVGYTTAMRTDINVDDLFEPKISRAVKKEETRQTHIAEAREAFDRLAKHTIPWVSRLASVHIKVVTSAGQVLEDAEATAASTTKLARWAAGLVTRKHAAGDSRLIGFHVSSFLQHLTVGCAMEDRVGVPYELAELGRRARCEQCGFDLASHPRIVEVGDLVFPGESHRYLGVVAAEQVVKLPPAVIKVWAAPSLSHTAKEFCDAAQHIFAKFYV